MMNYTYDTDLTENCSSFVENSGVSAALSWLLSTIDSTEYGEIGLSFVVHSGRVVRVHKQVELSIRIEDLQDGI